jgi:ElaB/YqjD/DUF883 family membrane-anchored ribosome-binding protein
MIDDTGEGFEFEDVAEDSQPIFSRATDRGREQLYGAADRSKGRLADAIETAADQLDDQLSHTAHYLRTHDVEIIRDDFIDQVRRHPLLSAGIAVGTGYLIGKVLGGGGPRSARSRIRAKIGHELRQVLLGAIVATIATRARPAGGED